MFMSLFIVVFYKLVDGTNDFEGRLEVRNSIILLGWGTVCNNMFNDADARVVCRSMHLL